MSNMTYNPNVDIPPYHGFDNNDGPRAMDFPSDGNFRGGSISYDVREQNPRYDVQYEPRIDSRSDSRSDLRMDPRSDLRIDSRNDSRMEHYDARPRRKLKERMVSQSENPDKFNWKLLLKKIVIYTILFLVLNHIKTHEIVCGLLPFLNNNELVCMTFKGLLFALIITILLPMVL